MGLAEKLHVQPYRVIQLEQHLIWCNAWYGYKERYSVCISHFSTRTQHPSRHWRPFLALTAKNTFQHAINMILSPSTIKLTNSPCLVLWFECIRDHFMASYHLASDCPVAAWVIEQRAIFGWRYCTLPYCDYAVIGSDDALSPAREKPLSEPMPTYGRFDLKEQN